MIKYIIKLNYKKKEIEKYVHNKMKTEINCNIINLIFNFV